MKTQLRQAAAYAADMGSAIHRACLVALLVVACVAVDSVQADHFTIRTPAGTERLEARLAGSGQGQHVLELADGQFRIVPQGAVVKRETADGPEPLTAEQVLKQLEERFGEERHFRGIADGHYVIGLVLSGPLDRTATGKADSSLKKAVKFMKTVERNFLSFARRMKIRTEPPTHPLVLLIFETDTDFEKYHRSVTGGSGMSSGNVAGFYSPLSNWLVIRMTECLTFETPLHEAIHQQVFNQHVFKRLAPTPAWFNEGIATGFEGGGQRINRGPARVSARYSRLMPRVRSVSWNTLVGSDGAFRGDVFAGVAYTQAWGMHWLLVTKYKDEYAEYVRLLSEKEPLEEATPSERREEFEEVMGKSPTELQTELPRALTAALRRQKLPPLEQDRPGSLNVQSNLADITVLGASGLTGRLETAGTIRNISTIRPMTFHVLAVTDAGQYAEWVVPNLGIGRQVPLARQLIDRRLPGARGGISRSFSIRVQVTPPESEAARDWQEGRTPIPSARGRR